MTLPVCVVCRQPCDESVAGWAHHQRLDWSFHTEHDLRDINGEDMTLMTLMFHWGPIKGEETVFLTIERPEPMDHEVFWEAQAEPIADAVANIRDWLAEREAFHDWCEDKVDEVWEAADSGATDRHRLRQYVVTAVREGTGPTDVGTVMKTPSGGQFLHPTTVREKMAQIRRDPGPAMVWSQRHQRYVPMLVAKNGEMAAPLDDDPRLLAWLDEIARGVRGRCGCPGPSCEHDESPDWTLS
jgi:hypothetical protein